MQQETLFYRSRTFNRKKMMVMFLAVFFVLTFLIGRLVYLMVFCSEYYGQKAENLHERERDIKAARGKIIDASGTVLATNRTVCTISVIHSQITELCLTGPTNVVCTGEVADEDLTYQPLCE